MNEAINELEYMIEFLREAIVTLFHEYDCKEPDAHKRGCDAGKIEGLGMATKFLIKHIESLKLNPQPSTVPR